MADQARAHGGPILIVEDDVAIRSVLADFLHIEALAVVCAENGRVALDRIAERRPGLILLDLGLPEMDGREFATQLRELNLSIPIVVMTAGHAADAVIDDIGAVAIVAKPFDLEELNDVITRFNVPFPGGLLS